MAQITPPEPVYKDMPVSEAIEELHRETDKIIAAPDATVALRSTAQSIIFATAILEHDHEVTETLKDGMTKLIELTEELTKAMQGFFTPPLYFAPAPDVSKDDFEMLKPQQMHDGDAAFDLKANETLTIKPHEQALVGCGITCAFSEGHVGLVFCRSGIAAKSEISVGNGVGVIDSGYRGEIKVILHNHGENPFFINKGDRIAQFMLLAKPTVDIKYVDSLESTDSRGNEGFGSTGVK